MLFILMRAPTFFATSITLTVKKISPTSMSSSSAPFEPMIPQRTRSSPTPQRWLIASIQVSKQVNKRVSCLSLTWRTSIVKTLTSNYIRWRPKQRKRKRMRQKTMPWQSSCCHLLRALSSRANTLWRWNSHTVVGLLVVRFHLLNCLWPSMLQAYPIT